MKTKIIVNAPRVIHIIEDEVLGKKFKGIAKCNSDDTWDEEKGKKIARLRAEIKRDINILKKLIDDQSDYIKIFDDIIEQYNRKISKVDGSLAKKEERLAELL